MVLVSEALEAYVASLRARGAELRTISTYRSLIARTFSQSAPLDGITPSYYLDRFAAQHGSLSVGSQKLATIVLRAFFKWCREQHYMEQDPLSGKGDRPKEKREILESGKRLGPVLDAYLAALEADGDPELTIKNAKSFIGGTFDPDMRLAAITHRIFKTRFNDRFAPSLPRSIIPLSRLKHFFYWCRQRGLMAHDPTIEPIKPSDGFAIEHEMPVGAERLDKPVMMRAVAPTEPSVVEPEIEEPTAQPTDVAATSPPEQPERSAPVQPMVHESDSPMRTMRVEKAIDGYIEALRAHGYSPSSIRAARGTITRLLPLRTRTSSITSKAIELHLETSQVSVGALLQARGRLAHFFEWCREEGLMTHDPLPSAPTWRSLSIARSCAEAVAAQPPTTTEVRGLEQLRSQPSGMPCEALISDRPEAPSGEGVRLDEALEAFAVMLRERRVEDQTIRGYATTITSTFTAPSTRLADINHAYYTACFTARFGHLKESTQKTATYTFRAFFKWCRTEGFIYPNPLVEMVGESYATDLPLPTPPKPPWKSAAIPNGSDIAEQGERTNKGTKPIGKALKAYLKVLKARYRSDSTIRNAAAVIGRTFPSDATLADITPEVFEERFTSAYGACTLRSQRTYRYVLRGFFDWCCERGWLDDDPIERQMATVAKAACPEVPPAKPERASTESTAIAPVASAPMAIAKPPVSPPQPTRPFVEVLGGLRETPGVMMREDIERVLGVIRNPRDALFFRLLVETGIPARDLLQLRSQDIDPERMEAIVHGSKDYSIKIEGESARLLSACRPDRHIKEGYLFVRIKTATGPISSSWPERAWRAAWAKARTFYKFEIYTRSEDLFAAYAASRNSDLK